jgi:hypothetical protein
MKTFFGGGWGTGGRERRWGEVAQTMYTQVSKGKNDKIKNNNKKEKKRKENLLPGHEDHFPHEAFHESQGLSLSAFVPRVHSTNFCQAVQTLIRAAMAQGHSPVVYVTSVPLHLHSAQPVLLAVHGDFDVNGIICGCTFVLRESECYRTVTQTYLCFLKAQNRISVGDEGRNGMSKRMSDQGCLASHTF